MQEIVNLSFLTVSSLFDVFNKREIPDIVMFSWLAISLLLAKNIVEFSINFTISFTVFQFLRILKFGEADCYSLAIIGASNGFSFSVKVLLISSVLSLIFVLIQKIRKESKKYYPFLPFILASYSSLILFDAFF